MKLLLTALIVLSLAACDTKPDTDYAEQLASGISRDIAGDFNVTDTISRSQERIADLYSGYGEIASAPVKAALRDWASGMTSGDYDRAAAGITATSDACAAEGF
jgi:hypothetical protein